MYENFITKVWKASKSLKPEIITKDTHFENQKTQTYYNCKTRNPQKKKLRLKLTD